MAGRRAGPTKPLPPTVRDLIAQASQQFDDARAALQAGDFAGYGLEIGALQKTLRDLQALQQQARPACGRPFSPRGTPARRA